MRQKSRRTHSLSLYLCVPILLLAVVPAWGAPGRGVYVNGLAHKLYLTGGLTGYIALDKGTPYRTPGSPIWGAFTLTATVKSSYSVCRSTVTNPAEGVAVFNNQIFYAYAADRPASATPTTSCGGPGGSPYAWVATFDMDKNQWISNRAVAPVNGYANSGTAITVFDNQLYLFADSGTYTSGDGVAWAGPQTGLLGSSYEPLDAVTIDPPGAEERILIVYSDQNGGLESANWNGQAGTASNTIYDHLGGDPYVKCLSLLRGTFSDADEGGPDFGAKAPVVQLFGIFNKSGQWRVEQEEYRYDTSPGTWSGLGQPVIIWNDVVKDLFVYPWFETECGSNLTLQDLRQYLQVNDTLSNGTVDWFYGVSDAMIPLNNRGSLSACGDFGGTGTDTGADDPNDKNAYAIRQHYWSLVGVILGSPPFAVNGYTQAIETDPMSNVDYGQETGTQVEQTNEMSNESMFSAGTEVRAGMAEKTHVTSSFDVAYKHGWEAAHGKKSSITLNYSKRMGTEHTSYEQLGTLGWALFHVPVMVVQDWALYAYDYDPWFSGIGTPLNQDLQTISEKPDSAYIKPCGFDLKDPGSTSAESSCPGLLAGMGPFRDSTNLDFWFNPKNPETNEIWNWESDPRWITKLGDGTLPGPTAPHLTYTSGTGDTESLTLESETTIGSGSTRDVEFTKGLEIGVGSKLAGFNVNLDAGYEGSYKSETTETTSFGSEVSASLGMKNCEPSGPGCVTDLTVQPYFLQATDPTAPWIPTAYQAQLPWCITWKVAHKQVVPGTAGGAIAGTAPAPLSASGRIVSGKGGGEEGAPYSHYSLEGGRLVWVDANGAEKRIPMTADEFVPSQGVSFEVHGFSWSSVGEKGSWTRSGNVWAFQPDGSVKQNRVTLKLDFDQATYDLQIERADFAAGVLAGFPNAQLTLVVNNQYRFYTVLRHDMDIAWRWSHPPANHDSLQVASLQGRYNSANGSGKMSMAGILPAQLPVFGDMGLEINGRQVIVPLITMDHFAEALQFGDVLRYEKDGMTLVVDFGKKTWSATFNEKAFNALLAPRVGKIRERVFVGGNPWFKGEHAVVDFSMNLKLSH